MKVKAVKEKLFHELTLMENQTKENIERLKSEDRSDEAVFERVKLNIYDIYRKMFEASQMKVQNQADDKQVETLFKAAFLHYFEVIPKNWFESLEEAKANDDFEKVHIEEVKIKTMEQIKTLFESLWEATYE